MSLGQVLPIRATPQRASRVVSSVDLTPGPLPSKGRGRVGLAATHPAPRRSGAGGEVAHVIEHLDLHRRWVRATAVAGQATGIGCAWRAVRARDARRQPNCAISGHPWGSAEGLRPLASPLRSWGGARTSAGQAVGISAASGARSARAVKRRLHRWPHGRLACNEPVSARVIFRMTALSLRRRWRTRVIIRQRASFIDPLLLGYVLPVLGRPRGILRYIVRWWNCPAPRT
jgi:hypothetical protein